MKTCTIDLCDKKHAARGYCKTHYNKLADPNRHPKKLIACAYCGTEVMKGTGGGRKYGSVCSAQCREWLARPYCTLPADHWARWYGRTSLWTAPKAKPARFIANTCDECGEHFVELNHNNVSAYCSKRCSKRVARRTRKAREHNSPGNFRWVEVIKLWIAAGKRCSYCDKTMTEQPDPDHVVPISRGGRNDLGNIVPCCHLCNADKCDLTLEEWAIERAKQGKPARRYVLPFTDQRFKHLTQGAATGAAWRHALAA